MKITWFGHSAFRLEFGAARVLIDPFFTGNPAFAGSAAEAAEGTTHVLVTHGHGDHVGDTVDIATSTGAKVVTNYDLGMWLVSKGIPAYEPMNTGGTVDVGGFRVSLVRADHSAAMNEMGVHQPLGPATGVVVKAEGQPTVWHMGDTDVFSDMALIDEIHRPEIVILPIGDRFTMGAETAALAVKRFLPSARVIVPCHYGSFGIIAPNADAFAAAVAGTRPKLLVPPKGEAVAV